MIPIFIAFHNAAGETSHALLPRASPHATTHLPDVFVDSIDLSVFPSGSHSVVRLRIFEDYVLLSTVPDASSNVYIQMPASQNVPVPKSTQTDTAWVILLDGAQFTYAALRCSLEFDHDHSISDSMRPLDIPPPSDHFSLFQDSEMLSDAITSVDPACVGPSTMDRENTDIQPPSPSDRAINTDTRPHASPVNNEHIATVTVPTEKRPDNVSGPNLSLRPALELAIYEPAASSNPMNDAPEAKVETVIETQCEEAVKDQSQVLQPRSTDVPPRGSCSLAKESRVTSPVHQNPNNHHQSLHESRTLELVKPKPSSYFPRESGQESQVLPEKYVTKFGENPSEPSQTLSEMKVTNTAFVDRNIVNDPSSSKSKPSSRNLCIPKQETAGRSVPPFRSAPERLDTLNKPAGQAPRSAKDKAVLRSRNDNFHLVESPDILAPSQTTKRRVVAEAFDTNTSSSRTMKRVKLASPNPEEESSSTDVSTTSAVSVDHVSRWKSKPRRSSRSKLDSVSIPPNPVILSSTKCTIQKKKRTMETFLGLGGTVTKVMSDADLLCVPTNDGLKKTPKLILAVILGKAIVTEEWLVNCAREGIFLRPDDYQPQDRKREQEWGVELPKALNRARCQHVRLDRLFRGYKLYLTYQLQNQLSSSGNLEAFIEIGTAMGATAVRQRLPVKFGSKMLVLGVADDFDAIAVGKLGFPLYDKDLLTMSALRGRRETSTGEFEIDVPVKLEDSSQS